MPASASNPEIAIVIADGDGRRARRDANRDRVLSATIELLIETYTIPRLQDVAERSGVSLRSLHRYFDEADAVVAEAYLAYLRWRPAPTSGVPAEILIAPLADRIDWRVGTRADECHRTNRAYLAMTARANRSPRLRETLETGRWIQIDVVRRLFAPELANFAEPERAARLALAHTATASESWDNLTRRHGLDCERARAVWTRTLYAALAPTPVMS